VDGVPGGVSGVRKMAKKKDAAALFEVIFKGKEKIRQDGLSVPVWMGEQPAPEADLADEPAEKPPSPGPVKIVAQPAGQLPVFTAGGRLRLSLNYTSCVVVAAALIILLAGAFVLGRLSAAGSAVQGEISISQKVPLRPDVVDDVPGQNAPPKRQDGKYYLVIQALEGAGPQDLTEVRRIAEYCRSHGEPAEVKTFTSPRSGKRRYAVWSLTALESDRDEKATKHAEAIEQMGKRYFAQYKTYDFRQRDKNNQFKAWYIRYSEPKGQ